MKAIHLTPHRLTDPIVLAGIRGIKRIKEERKLDGHVAGGMGVQSYLPEEAYRQSVDLDFSLLWAGSTSEFRQITQPLVNFLESQGYLLDFKKKGLTYEYTIQRRGDSLLLQHQRRSQGHFEKRKKKFLQREMANQRTVSKSGLSYNVMSPDDLALHKLSRILVFNKKYGINLPSRTDCECLRNAADALKTDLLSRLDNVTPEEVARLRLFYDCFDVRCLANYAGLSKPYFEESLKDWITETEKEGDFRRLANMLEVSLD